MPEEKTFLEQAIDTSKRAFWYVFVFSAAINLMMLALPIYTLQVLDRVVASGSMETLTYLTLVTVGLFVAFGLFTIARQMTLIKISEWFDDKISTPLLANSLARASLSKNVSGSQNLRDFGTLKGFITGPAISAFFDVPWAFLFIIVLLMIHPLIGLLAIVGGIILFLAGILNERAVKKSLNEANEQNIQALNQIETSSRNAEAIEAMGMADAVITHWQRNNKEILATQTIANNRSAVISAIAKSFRMLLQILAIAIGTALFLNNEVSIGAIIAGSILLGRALAPFEQAIAAWVSFSNARKAYSRLQDAIKNTPKRQQSMDLPAPEGRISVENVIYAIPNTRHPIIKGLTFSMPPGSILGVIGASASGKSTLAKLLTGVYPPNSGNIRLDGADVYTWNRKNFGKYVGYLPQDVELFGGTVRDNIARMQDDATDDQVVTAAKLAGAHELILRLAHGYDTELGVGGSNLSAGQRQRIGLARAFFGQPKFIVLDEPNSNLDDAGEQALAHALKQAKALNITIIVIAHRPSVLAVVDKIMVMKDGSIADYGDAKDILAKYRGNKAQAQPKQLPPQTPPAPTTA